jgi:hypothetical protein
VSRRRISAHKWKQRWRRKQKQEKTQRDHTWRAAKPALATKSNPNNPYPMDTVEYWVTEIESWRKEWKAQGIT